MKRFLTFLVFLMSFGAVFAQSRVIVVMSEKYDDANLAVKTRNMTKAQRRDFVIQERMAFCQASQQNVMDFLNGFKGEVSGIEQYWAFNGFRCDASDEVIALLEKRADVAIVYRDEVRKMVHDMVEAKAAETRDIAWHVSKVNAPAVWSYNGSTGYNGDGVIVAVVDSGVDYNHVDIAGAMWDGGENFPHHGYDVCHDDDDPMDDYCHGTHVAGIVAGQGNAGTQTGIAPGAKIMAVKVLDETGYGSDSDLISGVHFAMNHGADIINLSLGDPEMGPSAVYRDLFVTVKDAGMVASVAAGNVGDTQYTYPVPNNVECPGNCPPPWLHPDQVNLISGGTSGVICVGATDANDAHCSFSSVGPVTWANIGEYNDYPYENGNASQPGLIRPDISAPGASVTSLNYQTMTGYVAYDGTSMATPCVSGVLALLLDANPELSPAELDSIIELTAANAGNTIKNNITGSGRVDALAAINALYYHGPTNLTADFDGSYVDLNWEATANASYYAVYRDDMCIANNLTSTNYTDHLTYASKYKYYVKAYLNNDITTLPSNYVMVEKVIGIQAEIINNTKVALLWDMPNCIYDGFETGNLYQNMWINDATCPWEVTMENPYEGSYCVRSTNKAMFSTSKISLAVNIPTTCMVSYYAMVDCFPLNGGGFFIDNVQYGETLKDKVPWTYYSVSLSPGNHLLEWKYGNQLTEGDYENAFYVDKITVGNAFNVYLKDCDSGEYDLVAENVINAQYVDDEWVNLPSGLYKYGVSADGGHTIYWSAPLDKDWDNVSDNDIAEVSIYPNPAHDYIRIDVETRLIASVQRVDLCDITGKLIISSTEKEINVSELESGMYFVNVLTEKGLVTKKITISR
ncbi:MAG: S8 family serine peptidase [Bacteroidales bacterium]|nr:S8 family serine peptidase [Bacteroidales bacterium]